MDEFLGGFWPFSFTILNFACGIISNMFNTSTMSVFLLLIFSVFFWIICSFLSKEEEFKIECASLVLDFSGPF